MSLNFLTVPGSHRAPSGLRAGALRARPKVFVPGKVQRLKCKVAAFWGVQTDAKVGRRPARKEPMSTKQRVLLPLVFSFSYTHLYLSIQASDLRADFFSIIPGPLFRRHINMANTFSDMAPVTPEGIAVVAFAGRQVRFAATKNLVIHRETQADERQKEVLIYTFVPLVVDLTLLGVFLMQGEPMQRNMLYNHDRDPARLTPTDALSLRLLQLQPR